jgi:hypothetical protein
MKVVVIFSALLLAAPLTASAATLPYKEVRNEAVRSRQPVVYARVADTGLGFQYRRDSSTGAQVGTFVGGLAGSIIGAAADKLADTNATKLSETDANAFSALMNRDAAQRELELALSESLASLPLSSAPVVVKPLAPGAPSDMGAFNEDPALIVELYASLLMDYRGLQVTAFAYELSPSASAAHPKSEGRVYRNRIDYISPLLSRPHVKTKDEIKADVAAVKAKYKGRKLSKQEQAQMQAELKEAGAGTTLEKFREPLMEQWSANDGAKLRDELHRGVKVVAQLLARDWSDYSPVEIREGVGTKNWGTHQDSTVDRQVRVYFGGPFAGSLVSQPAPFNTPTCQGITFKDTVPRDTVPKFCILH